MGLRLIRKLLLEAVFSLVLGVVVVHIMFWLTDTAASQNQIGYEMEKYARQAYNTIFGL